jgi:hypothetical protein
MQHVDIFVSSHETPSEGDYAASLGETAEHLVPVAGSSGVWDCWAIPVGPLTDLPGLETVLVEGLEDDSTHVRLKVRAAELGKRIRLRIYVLSQ